MRSLLASDAFYDDAPGQRAAMAAAWNNADDPVRYCGSGKGNATDTCSSWLGLGYAYE